MSDNKQDRGNTNNIKVLSEQEILNKHSNSEIIVANGWLTKEDITKAIMLANQNNIDKQLIRFVGIVTLGNRDQPKEE